MALLGAKTCDMLQVPDRSQRTSEDHLMAGSRSLKVSVDQERCQGHARCHALAPELFALDELGNAQVIGDGTVPPGLEDKAWLAKANCPELAIDCRED
jgi:ferredoxin